MAEEASFFAPESHWLTRSEAARYVGVSGESAIRAAEAKGLRGVRDPGGQVWHTPDRLDAWTWRGTPPTSAQKARVLRDARKAREQEGRARERKEELEAQRQQAEWEAEQARLTAEWNAEDALRAKVRRKAADLRAAFELAHMNERAAGEALGFKSYDADSKLRELVRRGLVREIPCPREPTTMMTFDGLREAESPLPLCFGGPFFLREDVLAIRARPRRSRT